MDQSYIDECNESLTRLHQFLQDLEGKPIGGHQMNNIKFAITSRIAELHLEIYMANECNSYVRDYISVYLPFIDEDRGPGSVVDNLREEAEAAVAKFEKALKEEKEKK